MVREFSFVCPFCHFFALVVDKEVWVVDIWDSLAKGGGWNPCFSRSFND